MDIWGLPGHEWAWILAGICMLIALGLSAHTLLQHLRSQAQPALSTYYIRVILMVPIYSIEAYLGLVFRHYSLVFEFLRDWYEAFVVFSFVQLLLAYLGGPLELARKLREKRIDECGTGGAAGGSCAPCIRCCAGRGAIEKCMHT